MSNSERTIKVSGHFSDKQITEEEFVKIFVEHVNELKNISLKSDWLKEINNFKEKVEIEVMSEFDRIYLEQNK